MLLHADNFNYTDFFSLRLMDIFKAVHEGHINRSKIGHVLISAIFSFSFLFWCSTFWECQDKTNK